MAFIFQLDHRLADDKIKEQKNKKKMVTCAFRTIRGRKRL